MSSLLTLTALLACAALTLVACESRFHNVTVVAGENVTFNSTADARWSWSGSGSYLDICNSSTSSSITPAKYQCNATLFTLINASTLDNGLYVGYVPPGGQGKTHAYNLEVRQPRTTTQPSPSTTTTTSSSSNRSRFLTFILASSSAATAQTTQAIYTSVPETTQTHRPETTTATTPHTSTDRMPANIAPLALQNGLTSSTPKPVDAAEVSALVNDWAGLGMWWFAIGMMALCLLLLWLICCLHRRRARPPIYRPIIVLNPDNDGIHRLDGLKNLLFSFTV